MILTALFTLSDFLSLYYAYARVCISFGYLITDKSGLSIFIIFFAFSDFYYFCFTRPLIFVSFSNCPKLLDPILLDVF